jgi:hypothetical protein
MYTTPKPWRVNKKRVSQAWTISQDLEGEAFPSMAKSTSTSERAPDPVLKQVMVTLEKMSTTETKAPMLQNATLAEYVIFRVAFPTYKEKKGLQNMSELIAKAAKTVFCTTYRITKSEFDQFSDEELQSKLDTHFDIADNNDYKEKIKKLYMSSKTNEETNVSNVQLYVQQFINMIADNPTYASAIDGGATPKVLNDLFIDGFKPPGFRLLVKDLGTTDMTATIGCLHQLYKDVGTYNRIDKRLNTSRLSTSGREQQNKKFDETPKSPNPTTKDWMCTKTQCNSKKHKPDECPFLHPHLWDSSKVKGGSKKGFAATISDEQVDTPPVEYTPDTKPAKRLDGINMVDLAAALQTINKKIEELKVIRLAKSKLTSIIPAKPNYFDSGNNYSVISDTSHIDHNTSISLTYSEDGLETAGGALLPIAGTGTMHELPAVFAPDSIASLTSVSQFDRE